MSASGTGKKTFIKGVSRKETMRVMADFPAFKDTEYEALAVRFANLASQADSNGELNEQQFTLFCMYALGIDRAQAALFFKLFDSDGSGAISASEFIHSASVVSSAPLKEKLEMCFSSLDVNGDGTLDTDELYNGIMVAKGLTADDYDVAASNDFKKLLDDLDKNNDGQVSKAEFMKGVLADKRLVDILGQWLRTIPSLREEFTVRLKALFKDIDTDSSGKLNLHEMTLFGATCLGGDKKKAKKKAMRLMKKMDVKGYDGIDEGEFLKYCAHMFEGKSDDEIDKAITFMVKHRAKK